MKVFKFFLLLQFWIPPKFITPLGVSISENRTSSRAWEFTLLIPSKLFLWFTRYKFRVGFSSIIKKKITKAMEEVTCLTCRLWRFSHDRRVSIQSCKVGGTACKYSSDYSVGLQLPHEIFNSRMDFAVCVQRAGEI